MQKKLIGIFILLSFLMIRSSKLMAADECKSAVKTEQQSTEKESKQTESADEDCLPAEMTFASYIGASFKWVCYTFKCIPEVYFSLPYPPPDLHS
jgi:hypothetical protein